MRPRARPALHAPAANVDPETVRSFGEEWSHFDQARLDEAEARRAFDDYFSEFPWAALPPAAEGFDAGCGSGRWARLAAPRVGRLHCVDASERALAVARRNLAGLPQVRFHLASIDALPFADGSMDFGYALGVLHHVPDPAAALVSCVRKLRKGAPFLAYVYYALENRPAFYRALSQASDALRRRLRSAPPPVQRAIATALAAAVYWPLARGAGLAESRGLLGRHWPLATYRWRSFYTMRTDAFDHFCTPLVQRFSRSEIEGMMRGAGLVDIRFRDAMPYWCAVGVRG